MQSFVISYRGRLFLKKRKNSNHFFFAARHLRRFKPGEMKNQLNHLHRSGLKPALRGEIHFNAAIASRKSSGHGRFETHVFSRVRMDECELGRVSICRRAV